MSIRYFIYPEHDFAYVQADGNITGNDIIGIGRQLFTDPKWSNGFRLLIDYRNIQQFDVQSKDVVQLVHQDKEYESLFDMSKCAILAESNVVFGVSRMWKSLSGNVQINSNVFRKLDDALHWLEIPAATLETVMQSFESAD